MSADNLGICPVCKKGADDEKNRTLREDYEISLNEEGLFIVQYYASCSTRHGGCGFTYTYEHAKQVYESPLAKGDAP